MSINKNLRIALLDKLKVSRQRLSQRAKDIKQSFGPMSTIEATYVIAHMEKLDLSKYLDSNTIERVRTLLSNIPIHNNSIKANKKTPTRPATMTIKFKDSPRLFEPYLTSTMIKDANNMAQLYPVYYVFENSLRNFIKRILENEYGKNWWDNKVGPSTKRTVNDRIKDESTKPWHGKRGQHEIFYTNFGDLRHIIEKNWPDFEKIFPSRPWITQKLEELEHPRNILAHHNPVNKRDQDRLKLYFGDWIDLLKSKKDEIP